MQSHCKGRGTSKTDRDPGEPGALNAVATKSTDGKPLVFKAVNPTDEAILVRFSLGTGTLGDASLQLVAPGGLAARNPKKVERESTSVHFDGLGSPSYKMRARLF